MTLQLLKNVAFGPGKSNATGSTGVGYTILSVVGAEVTPRTTIGVYQLVSGSGLYAAYIPFPDDFHGQVLWDTGTAFPSVSYAAEQYNVEENNPKVDQIHQTIGLMSGTLSQLYHINFGRWRIISNQMIFYADDNTTEIVRFNLLDDSGSPTMDQVFERRKV